jgi:predicted nucleic acid-binding protein
MQSWPRNILVDAGPLVALFLADDRHHRDALEFARKNTANLLTTWPVLTEAAHRTFTGELQAARRLSGPAAIRDSDICP